MCAIAPVGMENTRIAPTTSDHTQTLRHLTSRPPGALEIRWHAIPPCHVCGGQVLLLGERECVVRPSLCWLREVRLRVDLFCLDCFERLGSLTRVFENVAEWYQHGVAHVDHADHRPAVDILDVTFAEATPNVVRCCLTWAAACECGEWLGGGELDARFDLREFVQP